MTGGKWLIRPEDEGDRDAIGEVNRLAFGGDAEARLVDGLRLDGLVEVSLVAEAEGHVIGHILFSRIDIEGAGRAAALAPMAVRPPWQRRGVGSALVWSGLALCQVRGIEIVLVVGHPDYYPRFGFSAEAARKLKTPYAGDALMVLELAPGSLGRGDGRVVYPEAFERV